MQCTVCHPETRAMWCGYCMPVPKKYKDIWNFPAFNPIQTEAFGLLKKNSKANLLVLSKTNTGKTQIMEMAIQRRIEKGRKGKIIILEPLKALAKEKVVSLRKKFKWLTTIEVTSDVDLGHGAQRNKNIMKADIMVCSYEMLDVFSRASETYTFLNKTNLLVVDEVHELADISRGASLDGSITRFLIYKNENNQPIQLLALSATFDNSHHLKTYAEQFVKDVHVLKSDFSPIKVHVDDQIYSYPRFQRLPALMRTIPRMLNNKGELLVMFLSIGDTYKLVGKLNSEKPGIARCHNAELRLDERDRIEKDFRDRKFRVLACTPTLLAGVNLPCQSIILDVSYFNQEKFQKDVLPIQKITQAAGRVGRLPYYNTGYVQFICDNEVINIAKAEFLKRNICKGTILNKLDDILNVQINLQPQFVEDLMIWYKKSFSSISSELTNEQLEAKFEETLTWLEAHEYIQIAGRRLTGTMKGETAMKARVRPSFLEHALIVFKNFTLETEEDKIKKVSSKKFTDEHLLRLTEALFNSPLSDVKITEPKMNAIKDNLEFQWLRSRKNSRTLDWSHHNDYPWISNIAMSLRSLSYPLNMLLEDKKKKLYLKYLSVCYHKGIIPMPMIKLSLLLGKNNIQRIGNKRLILLQLNGYTFKNLKERKASGKINCPMHITELTDTPLPYLKSNQFQYDFTGKAESILPYSSIQQIKTKFGGRPIKDIEADNWNDE